MRIVAILLILGMIFMFACTGCDNKSDRNPADINLSLTTEPGNDSTTFEASSISEEPETTILQEASNENPIDEIKLDKIYHNERFNFDVSYPGIWKIYEEKNHLDIPDQGIIIFIDIDDEVSIDNTDINKYDYIRIYGQVSGIAMSEAGYKIGEFETDDGVKGISYFTDAEGKLRTEIVFFDESNGYGYGTNIFVSKEINDKYGDVINRILKSIKLPHGYKTKYI